MITRFERWMRTQITPHLANERGQDALLILILLIVIWLLVTGAKIIVQ